MWSQSEVRLDPIVCLCESERVFVCWRGGGGGGTLEGQHLALISRCGLTCPCSPDVALPEGPSVSATIATSGPRPRPFYYLT